MHQLRGDAAKLRPTHHHRQLIGHGLQHHHGKGVFKRGVGQHVGRLVSGAHVFEGAHKVHAVLQAQLLGLGLKLGLRVATAHHRQVNTRQLLQT